MQREARIYAVYAVLGAVVLVYAVSVAITAWSRFGLSGTFAIYTSLGLIFAVLSGFAAFVSFSFFLRSVGAITAVSCGFELLPYIQRQGMPTRVHRLLHLRTVGKQFAMDESAPAFVFFSAAGKVWVAEASTFQTAFEARRGEA